MSRGRVDGHNSSGHVIRHVVELHELVLPYHSHLVVSLLEYLVGRGEDKEEREMKGKRGRGEEEDGERGGRERGEERGQGGEEDGEEERERERREMGRRREVDRE